MTICTLRFDHTQHIFTISRGCCTGPFIRDLRCFTTRMLALSSAVFCITSTAATCRRSVQAQGDCRILEDQSPGTSQPVMDGKLAQLQHIQRNERFSGLNNRIGRCIDTNRTNTAPDGSQIRTPARRLWDAAVDRISFTTLLEESAIRYSGGAIGGPASR